MSKLVFNRDGGKTDEFGHLLGLARSMQGEVIEGLLVAANGSPNMTVNVPIGTAMIPTSSGGTAYKYFVGLDATESVAITTANPSNPRNDLIVMYVDVAVTASQSYTNNSNNMLKLAAVAGTPAASPADPSIANIQAAIGAANPYIILARVVVGAGVTQINSGNITDLRAICVPRRVDSTSFLDGAIPTNKIANSAITSTKLAPTYSVDANGWNVLDLGTKKIATKRVTFNQTFNNGSGLVLTTSSPSLPVGLANMTNATLNYSYSITNGNAYQHIIVAEMQTNATTVNYTCTRIIGGTGNAQGFIDQTIIF